MMDEEDDPIKCVRCGMSCLEYSLQCLAGKEPVCPKLGSHYFNYVNAPALEPLATVQAHSTLQ